MDELTGNSSCSTITRLQDGLLWMATKEGVEPDTPLDEVVEYNKQELVRRVAATFVGIVTVQYGMKEVLRR